MEGNKHGQLSERHDVRWCETHKQYHGLLYECAEYPQDIRLKIRQDTIKWVNQLKDPIWVQEQIDKGIPPYVYFVGL